MHVIYHSIQIVQRNILQCLFSIFLLQATCGHGVNEAKELFNLIGIIVNHVKLSEPHIQELLGEIKSVQRIFIKKVTEINRKSKVIADLSILSSEPNIKQVEFNDEQIPSSKEILDFHLNFLTETLHFLQITCESTSRLLCTHSKGNKIN